MNRPRLIRIAVIISIATVLIIWIGTTRDRPNGVNEEDNSGTSLQSGEGEIADKFRELGGKEAVAKLERRGAIKKSSLMTHEFWVDDEYWNQLEGSEKEHILYLLSGYVHDHDGVGQVNIFLSEDGTLAAELFGASMNIR